DRVPEVEHPVPLADEARAVDHVGLVVEDWLNQSRILGGVVLEVGVLHQHDVASRLLEALAQGCSLALVVLLEDNANLRRLGLQLLQNGTRAIGAAIVDNDDLFRNGNSTDAAG